MRTEYPLGSWSAAPLVGLVLLAFLAGCSSLQPGATLLTLQRGGSPPPPKEVTEAGGYYLFSANSDRPVTSFILSVGDQYGFRTQPGGSPIAFVVHGGKDIEINLPEGPAATYFWKFRKVE